MLRSISIELMWVDRPFPARVAAAADAGFDLVDLWDQRTSDIDGVARVAREQGIAVNGFFGNRDHPLCDASERSQVLDEISRNLEVAHRVGARQLHVFSNAIRQGGRVVPVAGSRDEHRDACVAALLDVAERAEGSGITLILEHLNDVYLPGYLWGEVAETVEVAATVDRPEVRVVFDTFHQQLSAGNLVASLRGALPWLGRIDIAEVPDRAEPGHGEIDMDWLRAAIEACRWDGTLTFEVVPSDGVPETAVLAVDRYFSREWCRTGPAHGAGVSS